MGAGNTKRETWEATNEEIVKYIGKGQIEPNDVSWFDNTNVKSMSFDNEDTDWRWSSNKNHESQEKTPSFYHGMTCQDAVDWYVSLKTDAYCLELADKFLMRERVDCIRDEEDRDKYCFKDDQGQWIFKDIRDLMFDEEIKLIRHVFSQAAAVDAETGAEVPVLDKRTNRPFVDRSGMEVYTCSKELFEEMNCSKAYKTRLSIGLLVITAVVANFINIE